MPEGDSSESAASTEYADRAAASAPVGGGALTRENFVSKVMAGLWRTSGWYDDPDIGVAVSHLPAPSFGSALFVVRTLDVMLYTGIGVASAGSTIPGGTSTVHAGLPLMTTGAAATSYAECRPEVIAQRVVPLPTRKPIQDVREAYGRAVVVLAVLSVAANRMKVTAAFFGAGVAGDSHQISCVDNVNGGMFTIYYPKADGSIGVLNTTVAPVAGEDMVLTMHMTRDVSGVATVEFTVLRAGWTPWTGSVTGADTLFNAASGTIDVSQPAVRVAKQVGTTARTLGVQGVVQAMSYMG
jgi:hypothetical protein